MRLDDAKAAGGKPVRRLMDVVIPVWDERGVDLFLAHTLPSLLAPGNLPDLAQSGAASLRLTTNAQVAERLRRSPLVESASRVLTVNIAVAPQAVPDADRALAAELERARSQGRDILVWRAGTVAAVGALAAIRKARAAGHRCVFAGACRLDAAIFTERIIPYRCDNGAIAVPARDLVRLALSAIDADGVSVANRPGRVLWRDGPERFAMASLLLDPVYIDAWAIPADVVAQSSAAIDADLPSWLDCADDEVHVFQDSDEFCCVELSFDAFDEPAGADDLVEFAARHQFGRSGLRRCVANLSRPIIGHADARRELSPNVETDVARLIETVRAACLDTSVFCRNLPHPGWGWLKRPVERQAVAVPAAAANDAHGSSLRFHHTLVVWGEAFTELFLHGCLPSLLSPGNIPAMASNARSVFNIHTTAADAARMSASPSIERLRQHIPVRFHVIDEADESELTGGNRYDLLAAFHREAHAAALADDALLIFLSPDILLSDGSMQAVERRVAAGNEVILITGIRTVLEEVRPWFEAQTGADGTMTLGSEALVEVALRSLHTLTQGNLWGGHRFHSDWPSQIFWKDGTDLLIAHCWQLHPLVVRPHRRSSVFHQTIDGDFLERAVNEDAHVHIMQDSREFCFLELSRHDHGTSTPRRLGPFDPSRFRAWAAQILLPNHRKFVRYPIVYRAGAIAPERLDAALDRTSATVGALLRQIDDILPPIPRLYEVQSLRAAGRLYIYGCGAAGRAVHDVLRSNGLRIAAFLDTNRTGEIDGVPLLIANDYAARKQAGDRVVVVSQYRLEIFRHLQGLGVRDGVTDGYPLYLALHPPSPPPRLAVRAWDSGREKISDPAS